MADPIFADSDSLSLASAPATAPLRFRKMDGKLGVKKLREKEKK